MKSALFDCSRENENTSMMEHFIRFKWLQWAFYTTILSTTAMSNYEIHYNNAFSYSSKHLTTFVKICCWRATDIFNSEISGELRFKSYQELENGSKNENFFFNKLAFSKCKLINFIAKFTCMVIRKLSDIHIHIFPRKKKGNHSNKMFLKIP